MRGRSLALVIGASVVLAVAVLLASGLVTQQGPSSPPSAAPSPDASPGASVRCTREPGSTASKILESDPCPGAIAAVELTVATVRLPIERLIVEPGPFFCNEIWPGVGTPRACSMFGIQPGQYMHAWVSFRGSDEVAAVMLGLDLPVNPNAPGATRPPWNATLVAVEVPPTGWVMP